MSSFHKCFLNPNPKQDAVGCRREAEGPKCSERTVLRAESSGSAATVRADATNTFSFTQTSATAAPQQINTTTTQVQDVHDKKARRPGRET